MNNREEQAKWLEAMLHGKTDEELETIHSNLKYVLSMMNKANDPDPKDGIHRAQSDDGPHVSIMTDMPIEPPFPAIITTLIPSEVRNPFSGESCMLDPLALAVYERVKYCELQGDFETMRLGIDWFIEHYAKEYMVLLD